VPVDKGQQGETEFHRFMETSHPQVGETILRDKVLSDETIEALKEATEAFKKTVSF
jgi:F-type H+-transporting ATPase subunit alpha